MTKCSFVRSVAGAILAVVASAGILAGCSDNAASPLPPNSDPLGNNATVKTSDPIDPNEANAVRENVRKNANDSLAVLPAEAAEIATGEFPSAEVYGVNLDYDSDSVNYEAIVRSGGNVYAVTVDPQTGEVIDKQQINNYYYTTIIVITPNQVRPRQACERARRIATGDVVEANIESIEGRTTYIIIILMPDNRYSTVYIDAESGRERRLQNNGDCEFRQGQDDENYDGHDRHKNKKGKGHYRHGKGKGYGHYYRCECECVDDDGQELPTGVISMDSAAAVARGYFTAADSVRVYKVEIETADSAKIYYDVSLRGRDSAEYEVRLDAFSGATVWISQTKGNMDSVEYQPTLPGNLVALSVARTAALAQQAGTVQSWKLYNDPVEGKWVYEIEVLTSANERKIVVVDATTGTFIRIR